TDATPAIPAADTAPAEVRSFEILYRVGPDPEAGTGEIHLWFAEPDRWRMEKRTEKQRSTVVAAGESVILHDLRNDVYLWQMRDQVAACSSDDDDLDVDFGARHRGWDDYVAKHKQALEDGCDNPVDEDTVLGRACYVYEFSFDPSDLPEALAADIPDTLRAELSSFAVLRWVDKQLFVPLRFEQYSGGKLRSRIEATVVRVNEPKPDDLFEAKVPDGARVFKGALSQAPDYLSDTMAPDGDTWLPDLTFLPTDTSSSVTYYAPQYLPQGFRHFLTGSDGERTWMAVELAAESGATLRIEQSRDEQNHPLPGLPNGRTVTINGGPGEIAQLHEPFERVVLVWEMHGRRFRVDAAEVPTTEVINIAASMTARTASAADRIEVQDPVAAQARVHFLLLVPRAVPDGFQLTASNITPYQKHDDGGETPEQILFSYSDREGRYFMFSEMRGWPGGEWEGADRIAIGDRVGWHRHDEGFGHELTWMEDGTEVHLNGNLSLPELLDIAQSFVLADPSARERVGK
ncbi:MAG: hypothetical protein JSV65_03600, partial [Armatimonadota bacterium]